MTTRHVDRETLAVTIQGVRCAMLTTEALLRRWEKEGRGKTIHTTQEA